MKKFKWMFSSGGFPFFVCIRSMGSPCVRAWHLRLLPRTRIMPQ